MDINQVSQNYGQKRVSFADSAKSPEDWKRWEKSANSFPFEFGTCWSHSVVYKVDDYEAEVGFFIDVLGFDCNTLSKSYAMFMGPQKDFYLSIRPTQQGESSTPHDAITIEFMITKLNETYEKLRSRGVAFVEEPQAEGEGSPMKIARFNTPHGISIRLWSLESSTSS